MHPHLRTLVSLLLICGAGCTIDRSGVSVFVGDSGVAVEPDAGMVADEVDAGTEPEPEADAGVPCEPADEVCDALDNDCDGDVDEDGCGDCTREVRDGVGYLFCETSLSWSTANDDCLGRGYRLAALEDGDEDAWVWERAQALSDTDWWVGLNDHDQEGTFAWTTGLMVWQDWTPFGFTHWAPDEPDIRDDRDCVELDAGDSGAWNETGCDSAQYYVCELAP